LTCILGPPWGPAPGWAGVSSNRCFFSVELCPELIPREYTVHRCVLRYPASIKGKHPSAFIGRANCGRCASYFLGKSPRESHYYVFHFFHLPEWVGVLPSGWCLTVCTQPLEPNHTPLYTESCVALHVAHSLPQEVSARCSSQPKPQSVGHKLDWFLIGCFQTISIMYSCSIWIC